jgi:hypothetical protein
MTLVREGAPELDPVLTADALLGSLGAELFLHQRRERELALAALKAHWEAMVRRLLDSSTATTPQPAGSSSASSSSST